MVSKYIVSLIHLLNQLKLSKIAEGKLKKTTTFSIIFHPVYSQAEKNI
jgi:hypothetical protein